MWPSSSTMRAADRGSCLRRTVPCRRRDVMFRSAWVEEPPSQTGPRLRRGAGLESKRAWRSYSPRYSLRDVLLRIDAHPAPRIDELLPDRWKPPPSTNADSAAARYRVLHRTDTSQRLNYPGGRTQTSPQRRSGISRGGNSSPPFISWRRNSPTNVSPVNSQLTSFRQTLLPTHGQ